MNITVQHDWIDGVIAEDEHGNSIYIQGTDNTSQFYEDMGLSPDDIECIEHGYHVICHTLAFEMWQSYVDCFS